MFGKNTHIQQISKSGGIFEPDLLAGYAPLNYDSSDPSYAGYENADGEWYIMKTVTAGNVRTFSYAKGDSGYSTAWTNRDSQSYDTFSAKF